MITFDSIYALLGEVPSGVAVLRGPDHIVELVNHQYEVLVGRRAAEMEGKAAADLFPELVGQGYIEQLDNVFASGKAFLGNEMELTLHDRDGNPRQLYLDFIYQPIAGDGGAPYGVFVHVTDVTRRVLARQRAEALARDLKRERDHLRQVVEVLPQGIAIGDATGAITHSNAEARRIWGRPPLAGGLPEQAGYGLWTIDGRPLPATASAYARSLLHGEVISGEQMLIGSREDGARIPVLQNSAPLRDESGAISGVVIAFSDISHLKALEHQKDEFMALVSHELRTPLTTILGNADTLLRHGRSLAPDDVEVAYRDILADAERLHRIVENMLTLSRLETSQDVPLEPVLLNRLVATAVADHRQQFPLRNLTFTQPDEPCVVAAVPAFVSQVVGNLLSNAEKYGPAAATITVILDRQPADAVLRVCDAGKGLNAVEAARVFDLFFRSDETSDRAAGLGLGLAVCKRLIELQGGAIWYATPDAGGSEFGFSLPLQR